MRLPFGQINPLPRVLTTSKGPTFLVISHESLLQPGSLDQQTETKEVDKRTILVYFLDFAVCPGADATSRRTIYTIKALNQNQTSSVWSIE
jgi:hypothetical protein